MTRRPWFHPFDFVGWELLLLRIGLALVVWFSFPDRIDYESQPDPVGLGRLIDFSFLGNQPQLLLVLRAILGIALLVYVSGRLPLISLGVLLGISLAHGTLDNSQGAATHHFQIVALVVLAQFAAHLWSRYRPDPRLAPEARAAWWSIQTFAATYLVTALTKIFTSGFFGWIGKARHYPLQLEKTRLSEYYNRLDQIPPWKVGTDPTLADRWDGFLQRIGEPIAVAFVSSPLLCQVALAMGLLLELGAVLALARRSWATVIGVGIIGLHLSISAIMDLDFRWNMALALVFLVNLPGLIGSILRERAAKKAV